MLPHIKRRAHQEKAVAIAREVLCRGKIPCLSLPTGSGKTLVGLDIADLVLINNPDAKVLIIANLSPLMEQWQISIDDFLGTERLCQTDFLWGARKRPQVVIEKAKIILAMAQTIERREWLPEGITHVIWDEAHLSWFRFGCRKVVEKFAPNAKPILLTATPYRLDGQQFGENVEIHQIATLRELILNKTLVPFRAKNIPGFVIKSATGNKEDYTKAEVEQVVQQCSPQKVFEEWNKPIVDGKGNAYRDGLRYSDLPTIGVVPSKDSAKFYCEYFTSLGKPGVIITDDTPKEERREAYARFRRGEVMLWSVVVLTIGFDEKCATVVLMLRATKSPALLTQILGRVLRSMEGKTEAYFLDFTGTMVALGRPDEIEDWTDVKQNPGKECPQCNNVCSSSQHECPNCGFKFPHAVPKEKEENQDGIPIVIDEVEEDSFFFPEDNREMEEIPFCDKNAEPRDYYRQLLRKAYISGQNPGKCYFDFRANKKFSPDPAWAKSAVFGEYPTFNNALSYFAYLRKVQRKSGNSEQWVWEMMSKEFGENLTVEWADNLRNNVRVVLAS